MWATIGTLFQFGFRCLQTSTVQERRMWSVASLHFLLLLFWLSGQGLAQPADSVSVWAVYWQTDVAIGRPAEWLNKWVIIPIFFFLWHWGPTQAMASSLLRFLDHTQRRTTVGSTPLDEWSARHRDLYLTSHNTHNRQTSMPPVGYESTTQQASGRRPTP